MPNAAARGGRLERTRRPAIARRGARLALAAILISVPSAIVAHAQSPDQATGARDSGLPIGGTAGPLDAITDVRRSRGRAHDAHLGQRKAGRGEGTGAHRRHRGSPTRQSELRSRIRRLVHAERQRRDDRHDLVAGVWHSRGTDRDHEHSQRWRGTRRDTAMAGREARNAAVGAADSRRDLRWRTERHQRLSR